MLNSRINWGSQFSASLSGRNSQHHSIHLSPEWKKKQPPPWVFTTFKWNGAQSSCESLRMWDAAARTFIRFSKLIQLKQPTQEHIRTEVQLCESTDELFLMSKTKEKWDILCMHSVLLHCYGFHFSLFAFIPTNFIWQPILTNLFFLRCSVSANAFVSTDLILQSSFLFLPYLLYVVNCNYFSYFILCFFHCFVQPPVVTYKSDDYDYFFPFTLMQSCVLKVSQSQLEHLRFHLGGCRRKLSFWFPFPLNCFH